MEYSLLQSLFYKGEFVRFVLCCTLFNANSSVIPSDSHPYKTRSHLPYSQATLQTIPSIFSILLVDFRGKSWQTMIAVRGTISKFKVPKFAGE
jgi:hypothetical protein